MCLCVGVCDGRGGARSLSLGSRSSVCLGGSLTVGRLSSSVKSRARKKSGFFFLCEERSSQLATTETDRPTSNGEGQRKKSRLFGCRPVTLRAGCHAPRDFFRGIFWYFWPGPGGWEERTTEEREREKAEPTRQSWREPRTDAHHCVPGSRKKASGGDGAFCFAESCARGSSSQGSQSSRSAKGAKAAEMAIKLQVRGRWLKFSRPQSTRRHPSTDACGPS